ncbi:MAG: helix-turn-helix domain-containing protein [Gammaproteobacteria bacterium]|uniref:shikimate kinase n=1 Tax=Ferrimicrobium acidiphilum TaxID=121039 RepID=UPI0023F3338F|nr:shikimate kinase [Ferrimicrobium acidiphilum]MCL5053236.1 helix-turn-helix domain-containing protein [Gammaproteobacteria bacterium]
MHTSQPLPTEYERIVAQLSRTLRSERANRRLSRYELAQRAQLSERYLAQLESGVANPSLTVLTRLAEALNLSLLQLLDIAALVTPTQAEYLIERLQSRVATRRLGIALVGLRGAGKTTLGRLLADRLDWKFFRLTELITERTQIPLDELFSLGGDAAFRRLELETLQQLIDTSDDQFVIEIGGGLVTNRPAYELLRRHWITIWLSTSPEEHMERVIAQGDVRPMHGNARAMDELRAILNERTPFYEAAELHLSTSNQQLEASLNALEQLVRQHLAADGRYQHPPTSFGRADGTEETHLS